MSASSSLLYLLARFKLQIDKGAVFGVRSGVACGRNAGIGLSVSMHTGANLIEMWNGSEEKMPKRTQPSCASCGMFHAVNLKGMENGKQQRDKGLDAEKLQLAGC